MWKLRAVLCVLSLSITLTGAAAEPAPEAISVGSISELDTEEFQRLIQAARAEEQPAVAERTPLVLSLADSIHIALEANLRLQIATLDRDVAEALVPAARAKFHPVPGFDIGAVGERLDDAPDDFAEPGDEIPGIYDQDDELARPFVRQELPTGGNVVLATDLIRESVDNDTDEFDPNEDENGDRYRGGVSVVVRQPLLRGGAVYVARREILDSEYNLEIAEADLRAQILQVTAQVKEAYFDTVLAQRLIEVSEEALTRDRALLEASRALFEAGRATRRDVLSAEIRISDGEASLAQNRGAFATSQLVLRNVLGTPIGQPVWPAEAKIPFQPVELHPDRWVGSALENRPEILRALARLNQTALAVRVASNDVLPALDFLGGYGRAGFGGSSRNTWDMNSDAWAAGLHFEIPFGNVAARERLRAAKLLNKKTERELRDLQRQIEIEVRSEVISLEENFGDLAAQTAKVDQARAKLETANTRFRLGLADNFDVTDAQEDLVSAETQLLTAIVDYVNSLARLEARVAGPL
jgi:outer membrane protein TolC